MLSQIGYSSTVLWIYIHRFKLLIALMGTVLLVMGVKAVFFTESESFMSALDIYFIPGLGALGMAFGAELKARLNRAKEEREASGQA